MNKVSWTRVCSRTNGDTCPVGAIPSNRIINTNGFTNYPVCMVTRRKPCRLRTHIDYNPLLPSIDGGQVMAGYRMDMLRGKTSKELMEIVQDVRLIEMRILMTWAKHFTDVNVPWIIEQRGVVFALWKAKKKLR